MLNIGDNVKVAFIPPKYQRKLPISIDIFDYTGIIVKIYHDNLYGVYINGFNNDTSKEGLFWFSNIELTKINNGGENTMLGRMEKFNYVAIVNLVEDYNKKDYGFALYDSEWEKCSDGCYVLVNPQNKITLGVIKEVKTVEEYGKNVTKEVVGVCNMTGYNYRIEARQRELERQKKETQLRKELDERISKLKDMEYYNRMAKELADKDPEIANLVSELGTVVVID